jgi:hypothetical protein
VETLRSGRVRGQRPAHNIEVAGLVHGDLAVTSWRQRHARHSVGPPGVPQRVATPTALRSGGARGDGSNRCIDREKQWAGIAVSIKRRRRCGANCCARTQNSVRRELPPTMGPDCEASPSLEPVIHKRGSKTVIPPA